MSEAGDLGSSWNDREAPTVACPTCAAPPFEACRMPSGEQRASGYHRERRVKAGSLPSDERLSATRDAAPELARLLDHTTKLLIGLSSDVFPPNKQMVAQTIEDARALLSRIEERSRG